MKLPRAIFVTGKGGTGKSTVAAALALALSRRKSTTLADLEGAVGASTVLGEPLRDSLRVVMLSRRAELHAFIRKIVPVSAISERMLKSRTFGYVTAALPGLEAFLLMERLRSMAGEAALTDGYVVIDAPASGTAVELLEVASGVRGIAPRGTLNRLAEEVEAFLADPARFGVVLTIAPEQFAIKEALETADTLRQTLGVEIAGAIINRSPEALFDSDDVASLVEKDGHRVLAARRVAEQAAAETARDEMKRASIPVFELPMIYRPSIGRREVSSLARKLDAEMLIE
jgi:arsenite/tail-anchored protein-transporting ATPase